MRRFLLAVVTLAAATALTVAPLGRSATPVARAEAMQRFLAANPGWHQATRAELRSMGVPDSVASIYAGCWGPGTYGYIIHYHPDSHRNTREKLCVGLDSVYDKAWSRIRLSCFYDATLKPGCRFRVQHARLVYTSKAENYIWRIVQENDFTTPGTGYVDTIAWSGTPEYTGGDVCSYWWRTDGDSQQVRYKVDGVLRALPAESSNSGDLC